VGKQTKFWRAYCLDCDETIAYKDLFSQIAWWSIHQAQGHDGFCEMQAS
jgi:hypothetical protein